MEVEDDVVEIKVLKFIYFSPYKVYFSPYFYALYFIFFFLFTHTHHQNRSLHVREDKLNHAFVHFSKLMVKYNKKYIYRYEIGPK